MTIRVDGHSWALSAIDELKVDKIITPLNKDHIPITDSPVVVQQHMLPPKKFVLLSAQVSTYPYSRDKKKRDAKYFRVFLFCAVLWIKSRALFPGGKGSTTKLPSLVV
jgi:hypothetical protein